MRKLIFVILLLASISYFTLVAQRIPPGGGGGTGITSNFIYNIGASNFINNMAGKGSNIHLYGETMFGTNFSIITGGEFDPNYGTVFSSLSNDTEMVGFTNGIMYFLVPFRYFAGSGNSMLCLDAGNYSIARIIDGTYFTTIGANFSFVSNPVFVGTISSSNTGPAGTCYTDTTGTNYFCITVPELMNSNVIWRMPSNHIQGIPYVQTNGTATGDVVVIGNGTSGQVLASQGTSVPHWADMSAMGSSSIIVTNSLFVSAMGNDSTAIRARLDLPFATITNAVFASKPGDAIYVGPGIFTTTSPIWLSNRLALIGTGSQTIISNAANNSLSAISILGDVNISNIRLFSYSTNTAAVDIDVRGGTYFTNIIFRNVDFDNKNNYSIIEDINLTNSCRVDFYNCRFFATSTSDVCLYGARTNSVYNFNDCYFLSALYVLYRNSTGQTGTNNFYNCRFTSTDTAIYSHVANGKVGLYNCIIDTNTVNSNIEYFGLVEAYNTIYNPAKLSGTLGNFLDRQMEISGRVYCSTNLSITNNVDQAIVFDTERSDYGNNHSTAAGASSKFFAPMTGSYMFGASLQYSNSAVGQRYIALRYNTNTILAVQNSAVNSAVGAYGPYIVVPTLYEMNTGDTMEVVTKQDSGGALVLFTGGNYTPEFWWYRVK